MKSAKKIIMTRRYTTRVNILLAIGFVGSFLWCVVDYQIKLKTHPDLPLIGMFFKVKDNTWNYASPFYK
jgi:nitrate reductase NapE component